MHVAAVDPKADSELLTLTLPDGATREVPRGTLPRDVVGSIRERLLRAAVAVSVNGEVQDLMTPLRASGAFRVRTEKDADALAVLRHSGAHVLATAVRRIRPDAKIGFVKLDAEGDELVLPVARPGSDHELAAAQDVERRELLGQRDRMVERDLHDRGRQGHVVVELGGDPGEGRDRLEPA